MTEAEVGSTITEAIKQTMAEIEAGLGDKYVLDESVVFEFSVVQTDKAGGGIDFRLVKLGADIAEEAVQTVSFSIKPKDDVSEQLSKEGMKFVKKLLEQANKGQGVKEAELQITKG